MKALFLLSALCVLATHADAQEIKKRLIINSVSTENNYSKVVELIEQDAAKAEIVDDLNRLFDTGDVDKHIEERNRIMKAEISKSSCENKKQFEKFLIDREKVMVVLEIDAFLVSLGVNIGKKELKQDTRKRSSYKEPSLLEMLSYSLYHQVKDLRAELEIKNDECTSAKNKKSAEEKTENLLKGYSGASHQDPAPSLDEIQDA